MKWPILILLSPLALSAQNPILSGTVTSGVDGCTYSNGTYNLNMIDPNGNDMTPGYIVYLGGIPYSIRNIQGTLDGFGHFSQSVISNAAITAPAGTKWNLNICSQNPIGNAGSIPPMKCLKYATSVTANLDLTSVLSPLAPPLGCPTGSPNAVLKNVLATQTMIGPLNVTALNSVQKADQFTGTTASEKITACLAALSGSGVCDATGLTGVQTMDATVEIGNTCIANGQTTALRQTLLMNQSTWFQPTVAGMTMFKVDCNGQLLNAHIQIPSALNFTGTAVLVSDNIVNQTINTISLDGLQIDAGTYYAGGTGLLIAPPSGDWVQLTNFHNIRAQGLASGMVLKSTGSGGYVNGNNFSDIMLEGNGTLLTLNAQAGSLQIDGNTFSNLQMDGSNIAISMTGSAPIQGNVFSPVKIWDTTTPISNTNSSALANTFLGNSDFSISDGNATNAVWPYQNIYMMTVNATTHWSPMNFTWFSVNGAPTWSVAQNAGGMGWNYTAGQAETDYFQNVYVGGTFAHAFYAANSGNTGWNLLGGWTPAGDWKLGTNIVLPNTLTGPHGNGTKVQLSDNTGTSGNLAKFDVNGNVTNGPSAASVPSIGSPTVGQAACIKAAGPPVVIGYCSTVVSAGGSCTCN